MRVVADTNILVSALLFGGPPEQVFLAGLRGEIQLFISLSLLKELEKVLKEKFKLNFHLVREIINHRGGEGGGGDRRSVLPY